MKFLVLILCAVGAVSIAQAQDAATMAAQQAADDAQRANQQAMQDTQQANNVDLGLPLTARPSFSIKQGRVKAGSTVRLKSSTHYAVIYYTTDGWTPTTKSQRYTGPIPITQNMQLQAIAVAPEFRRSLIARADYTVDSAASAAENSSDAVTTGGILRAGTPLTLVTSSTLDSKTAEVGDPLNLVLGEDIKVGDKVVAAKGTPVAASVTLADHSSLAGIPGDLAFEVHSFVVNGSTVALNGGETIEGADHYNKTRGFILIPVAGLAALTIHGDEAQIKPGMKLTAHVATDTSLAP